LEEANYEAVLMEGDYAGLAANLISPIIALIGLVIVIASVPILKLWHSPFACFPAGLCIIFGGIVVTVWLIFWLFPPQLSAGF
jgi:hypothetical protein